MLKFERSQTTELLNQPLGRLSSISQIFGMPEPQIEEQIKRQSKKTSFIRGAAKKQFIAQYEEGIEYDGRLNGRLNIFTL